MANEITVTMRINVANGSLRHREEPGPIQVNQSGTTAAGGSQSIPTTAAGTAVSVGSVSTLGYAYFRNVDTTNFVEIGVQVGGTFYPLMRLNAGEAAITRLSQSTTVYARANNLAVNLQYYILSN